MPLAFASISHGRVAFGFYNVETDSLLLEDLFFFCTDFCRAVTRLREPGTHRVEIPGHVFERREDIGDLMGAIHGIRLEGYLGEIYRIWPFPRDPALFRQKLRGHENRPRVEEILDRHARRSPVPIHVDPGTRRAGIGPYLFSERGFRDLLTYVHRGGYPTWEGFEEGACPPWVKEMARAWGLERKGA